MEETGNVILTDTLKGLGTDAYSNKKGERLCRQLLDEPLHHS